MAQGLSPYLTGNFQDETQGALVPTIDALMMQLIPKGVQSVKPLPPPPAQVPQQPVEEQIRTVKSQLAQTLPPPRPREMPMSAPIPQAHIENARRADWEENVKEALGGQDAGIAGLERYMQEYSAQPRETNYTALAGFVDAMTGSKLTPVAQSLAPVSEEKRQEGFLRLQDLLQQRRNALTQNSLAPYKAQLQAYQDALKTQAMGGRQERFESSMDAKLFDKANKDKATLQKEALDFRQSYRNVEDAITPDEKGTVSVGRLTQSLSQFARLMGEKGVLTDTDTGRQLAPTLQLQIGKLTSMLQSDPNARIPVKNVEAMQQALATAQKAFSESYGMKADAYRQGYFENPGSPYAGKEWAPQMVEDVYRPLKLIQSGGAPQSRNAPDLQNAAQQELMRRRGGK